MKLHIYTTKNAPYKYDDYIEIDNVFFIVRKTKDLNRIYRKKRSKVIEAVLNDDVVKGILWNYDWSELIEAIDSLYDKTTNGEFQWENESFAYYNHFEWLMEYLRCDLESDSHKVIETYTCELSEGMYLKNSILGINLTNFYSGNGEPIGAQLALDMADLFMRSHQWNVGFYDAEDDLIIDIKQWSKFNKLDINTIIPIVWFGEKEDLAEYWSITPDTEDIYVRQFWGDYLGGALPYICNANSGMGIYYSIWEYDLDYDLGIFENIKKECPIDLCQSKEDRVNSLFNLIISIYNENKEKELESLEINSYSKDVKLFDIVITNKEFGYSYSKTYKFKETKLKELNSKIIENILWEDKSYQESFLYLKEQIIDACDTSSYNDIWEKVRDTINSFNRRLNSKLHCQIWENKVEQISIPYSVNLYSIYPSIYKYLPIQEIEDEVFIKSLIEFFKRGKWHIGLRDAKKLPKICNEYAQVIPQEGVYPVVWFNDSNKIIGKMGIWSAQSQYMLSITWKSVSDFCSHALNNIRVHNNCRDKACFKDLQIEFERVKNECPIHIYSGEITIDFEELENVVGGKRE